MNENQLRTRLIWIFSSAVALVLLVVLLAVSLLFRRETHAQSRETFATLLFAVSDQIRDDPVISHSTLRDLEQKNHLLLSISDNGKNLLYNNSDSDEKKALLESVQDHASADGYDILTLPLTVVRRTSPTYSMFIKGTHYLGAVCILPQSHGYCTVTMVQEVSSLQKGTVALLISGYIVSLLLVCIVGIRLIDRALLPAMESRKRQTQFIAAASHELRSPLAVITANAADICQGTDASREAAAAIAQESMRMSRLISDMLLLAGMDAKNWPVTLSDTEVDTLLLNVYEAQLPVFARSGCILRLELPEAPLPHILADGDRLAQVLSILLDNALSYGITQEQRQVALSAEACAKQVRITVTDHGIGMTQEQKALAFERFYRGDASRSNKQHFGLGLSIACELIRLQSGRLYVEDTPGGGCTFRIVI